MTLILSSSIGRQIKLTNHLIDESGQETPRYDDTRSVLRIMFWPAVCVTEA